LYCIGELWEVETKEGEDGERKRDKGEMEGLERAIVDLVFPTVRK